MITITGVHKTYVNGEAAVHALRGVDLTIDRGEFVAIAGPSGSGKSTLLNIIGCLDAPDGGSVRIDAREVTDLSAGMRAAFRRDHLGFIFQSFNLVPVLSAAENVALSLQLTGSGRAASERAARAMLASVGLSGMEDRRPSRLSGGQQQRVAIARALVKRPLLVLADEPTANLDSTTGDAILHLMYALNRENGTTFVFSTHDPNVMRRATRLVQLTDGRVTDDRRTGEAIDG